MNTTDHESNALQKERDDLLAAAQEQPGVSEMLEIIDRANVAKIGYAVEVNEYHFIGSTSTTKV